MNVGQMTLYEFIYAQRGWAEANGAKPKGGTISDDRLSEMGVVGF